VYQLHAVCKLQEARLYWPLAGHHTTDTCGHECTHKTNFHACIGAFASMKHLALSHTAAVCHSGCRSAGRSVPSPLWRKSDSQLLMSLFKDSHAEAGSLGQVMDEAVAS